MVTLSGCYNDTSSQSTPPSCIFICQLLQHFDVSDFLSLTPVSLCASCDAIVTISDHTLYSECVSCDLMDMLGQAASNLMAHRVLG